MKIITPFILLLFSLPLVAQDPIFSQFFNNRVYLNPAFVGMDECLVLRFNYRNQWHNVPVGFTTYSATVESPVPLMRSGIALPAVKDQEGSGRLSTKQLGGYFSHYILTGKKSSLHFGAGGQFVDKSADFSRYVFSDQLDPVHGIVQPTAAPTLERRSYGDVAGGIAWRGGFKVRNEEGFLTAGLGLHHALLPVDELSPFGGSSPRRWSGHIAVTLPFWVDHTGSEKHFLFISPQCRVEVQKPLTAFSFGSYFTYQKLYGGTFWRFSESPAGSKNTDVLVFCAGVEIEHGRENLLRIEYSYDFDTSGLSTRPGGVHEVGIVWEFGETLNRKDFKNKGKKKLKPGECPRYQGKGSVNRH